MGTKYVKRCGIRQMFIKAKRDPLCTPASRTQEVPKRGHWFAYFASGFYRTRPLYIRYKNLRSRLSISSPSAPFPPLQLH